MTVNLMHTYDCHHTDSCSGRIIRQSYCPIKETQFKNLLRNLEAFSQKKHILANKHMKPGSISLIMREIQINYNNEISSLTCKDSYYQKGVNENI